VGAFDQTVDHPLAFRAACNTSQHASVSGAGLSSRYIHPPVFKPLASQTSDSIRRNPIGRLNLRLLNIRQEDKRLPRVTLRDNESQQQLFSRFRRKVTRSGVLGAVRRKRWFVSKSEQRRIEKKKGIRKMIRRRTKRGE
jgi:small subunit ribosomal protein S21